MHERAGGPGVQIVGREPELALLHEVLAVDRAPGAFILTGGPGIGKTTLLEAGIEAARERGLRVLSARPSGAEAQHSFAAVTDILDDADTDVLAGLPAPQRRALEVALLRAEPTETPAEPLAIATGLLNALRALAAREPLLVAVDDVQWLDSPSADALAYAARRLGAETVGFLLAKRSGTSSGLEQALERRGLERLEVGPLSLGATRRLLSERLELTLPRHVLRRIFESAAGNPLFALELGRKVAERGPPEIGDEIPVPTAVEDLLGARVERLPHAVRRLLVAVALSADLRVSQLAAIADPRAVDEAFEAGVLVADRDRVRAAHPLLAAAAKRHSRERERRELHLELARVVADEGRRARHLALATERPDPELAATIATAAAGAAARGAAQDAVELAEHALRLTPADRAERTDRLLALAQYLDVAGEDQRVTDLLTTELESLPRGAPRARAHLMLADSGGISHVDEFDRHLEQALVESNGDPALRASVLALKSTAWAVSRVECVGGAEAWALEATDGARGAAADVERLGLYALGWARSLRGAAIDDLHARYHAVSDAAFIIGRSLDLVAGVRLGWRGDVSEARASLTPHLAIADERGEGWSYVLVRLHLCEVALRAGEWETASRLLDEWHESSDGGQIVGPLYERCRALLAAGRGRPDEGERWVAETIAGAEATGVRWDWLEALRARGILALLAHEPAQAIESLRPVWEHTQREGVDDPGVFPAAPDLVEALVEVGEHDEALRVTNRLKDLAEQQEHPWGLASAKRCDALVRLASPTYDEEAATDLADAAAAYDDLGLRFDRARSLLSLGRAQRRLKKWGAARRTLDEAEAAFDDIGSDGWAEHTRSELARVGARRPQPTGELTPTERRVAELAAQGLSNKEIARALFVTVHTVEVHLSHAYAKLGIRSRAQLTGRLSA